MPDCLCDGLCEIAGLSALEMPRQNEIGFRRGFCGLLEEQLTSSSFDIVEAVHGSPLRPDGTAEGVAKGASSILRPSQ